LHGLGVISSNSLKMVKYLKTISYLNEILHEGVINLVLILKFVTMILLKISISH